MATPEDITPIPQFQTETLAVRFERIKGDIAKASTERALDVYEHAEASKQPITRDTFVQAFQNASATDDYQSFMSAASPLPASSRNEIFAQVQYNKAFAEEKAQDGRFFSDAELNDSFLKEVANNLGLAAGRGISMAGSLISGTVALDQLSQQSMVESEDQAAYASVKKKEYIVADAMEALKELDTSGDVLAAETELAALRNDPKASDAAIQKAEQEVTRLSDVENKANILRERVALNSPNTYTDAERALYDVTQFRRTQVNQSGTSTSVEYEDSKYNFLKDIERGTVLKEGIKTSFDTVLSMMNTSAMDVMMLDARTAYDRQIPKYERAKKHFEEGRNVSGAMDMLGLVGGLISEVPGVSINNPAGLIQVISQSIPDIMVASTYMPAALAVQYVEKQPEAVAIYRKTHDGKDPTGNDLLRLNATVAFAAAFEIYGDRLMARGGINFAKHIKGDTTLTALMKGVTKTTQGAVSGAAGEFIAEGGAAALTQYAGTQDASKVDYRDAYAQGVLGAGAGGAITAITSAPNAIQLPASIPLKEKMANRQQAKADKSIKPLVSNISTMDIPGATAVMRSIITDPTSTPEQKAEAIVDLEKAFDQAPLLRVWLAEAEFKQDEGATPERAGNIARAKKILEEVAKSETSIQMAKKAFEGHSVGEAYKALTTKEAAPEGTAPLSAQRAADIVYSSVMGGETAVSADMAQTVLNTRANILTPTQTSSLAAYVASVTAMDTLQSDAKASDVHTQVIHGGKGNVGASTYMQGVLSSLKHGDMESAKTLSTKLETFAQNHEAKAAAMSQIIESFKPGNIRMGAQEQVALLAPFQPPGKAHQPFVRAVPAYAKLVVAEAQALRTVSNEMTKLVDTFGNLSNTPETGAPVQGSQSEPAAGGSVDGVLRAGQTESVTPNTTTPVTAPATASESAATAAASTAPQATPTTETVANTPAAEETSPTAVQPVIEPTVDVQPEAAEESTQAGTVLDGVKSDNNVLLKHGKATKAAASRIGEVFNTLRAGAVTVDSVASLLKTPAENVVEAEGKLLALLKSFNTEFRKAFVASTTLKPIEQGQSNPLTYFQQEDGTIKDEVLDAMSVAAFEWFIASSTDSVARSADDIASILGIAEKNPQFDSTTWDTVGRAGMPFNEVANDIGSTVFRTLGITLDKDAPATLRERLHTALGGHTVLAMANMAPTESGGLLKLVHVSRDALEIANRIENHSESYESAVAAIDKDKMYKYPEGLRTVQASYSMQGEFPAVSDLIQSFGKTNSQARGVLNKLFDMGPSKVNPGFEPAPVPLQMLRTDRKVSAEAKAIHKKFNETPTYLKADVVKVMKLFGPEAMATMYGYTTDVAERFHKDDVKGEISKNNLIRTSIDKAFDFITHYESTNGVDAYDVPFYLHHETTRVNRNQMNTRNMNMISDKVARHMAYRKGWDVTIPMNDEAMIDTFMLSVAQSLDIALDKNTNAESLVHVTEALNDPVISAGVEAAQRIIKNENTLADLTSFQNAVVKAGTKAAAVDGLMAMAAYVNAVEAGDTDFKVNIGIEFDGVTNGPMFLLMQYGRVDGSWASAAAAGGIYINSTHTDVAQAKADGVRDTYERGVEIFADLQQRTQYAQVAEDKFLEITPQLKAGFQVLFGNLSEQSDDGAVTPTKAGRNLMKEFVTPKIYQAQDATTQKALGKSSVRAVRKALTTMHQVRAGYITEDAQAAWDQAVGVIKAVDAIAPGFVQFDNENIANSTVNETKKYSFKYASGTGSFYGTFADYMSATYGKLLTESVNELNIGTAALTDTAVQVSSASVMMYEMLRNDLIQEIRSAYREANPQAKGFDRDLTAGELADVDARLQEAFPEVATAMSKVAGTGVSLVRMGSDPSSKEYSVEFDLTENSMPFYGLNGKPYKATKRFGIHTYGSQVESPGVRGVVNNNLALDGATALQSLNADPSQLQFYDAGMSGITNVVKNANNWNDTFLKNNVNFSTPMAIADMAEKVYAQFVEKYGTDYTFSDAMISKYRVRVDPSTESATSADIGFAINSFRRAADKQYADRKRVLNTSNVVINQYYMEGAGFAKTSNPDLTVEQSIADTAEAVAAKPRTALQDIDDALQAAQVPPNSINASADNVLELSESLRDLFNKKPQGVFIAEALSAIKYSTPAMQGANALLKYLTAAIPASTKVVVYQHGVRYSGELAWMNENQDLIQYGSTSRGFFAPVSVTGSANTIVLMGANMPYTGLTTETLVHESIHAFMDGALYLAQDTPAFREVQNLIKTVKGKLEDVLKDDPESRQFYNSMTAGGTQPFAPLSNMREFMAWGLSSDSFQRILEQVSYSSVGEMNNRAGITIRSVFARLRKIVLDLITAGRESAVLDNALKALITSTVTVLQVTGKVATGKGKSSLSRMAAPLNKLYRITKMNSVELFKTLRDVGYVKATAQHQVHLEKLLDSVINNVLAPLQVNVITSATPENIGVLSANSKLDLYIADGQGGYVGSLPSTLGFNKSAQEEYVHNLYLNVIDSALKENNTFSLAADKLFTRAQAELSYTSFMKDSSDTDAATIAVAKGKYDSVFNVSTTAAGTAVDQTTGLTRNLVRSDYLRNFLALSATNEGFRNALSQVSTATPTAPVSMFEQSLNLISRILQWFSNRASGVNSSKALTDNLDMLTVKLVGAELHTKAAAEQALDRAIELSSDTLNKGIETLRKTMAKVGNLPVLKNSNYSGIRLAGRTARILGNNHTQHVFDVSAEMFKSLSSSKRDFAKSIVNEVKGTTDDNSRVHNMLRVANYTQDRARREIAESLGRTLKSTFKRALSNTESTVVTKGLLRLDVASLIPHGFTTAEIADLFADTRYRNAEIGKLEAQIQTLTPALATHYFNQAEDLGYKMNTNQASSDVSADNAYGVVRLWGTSRRAQTPSEADLARLEPLVDALATLHGISYYAKHKTSSTAALVDLIRHEQVEENGKGGPVNNGIQFALTNHRLLKEKALRDNFHGNPGLMRKGYMPDITNTYIDVQVAPKDAEQDMIERGYYKESNLANDPLLAAQGAMAVYVANGGGLAGYIRGSVTMSSKRAMGKPVEGVSVNALAAAKATKGDVSFTTRIHPSGKGTYAQALFNEHGDVVGHRYLISEATKDDVLGRRDNFDEVMGRLAGQVFERRSAVEHNQEMIDQLKVQFDEDMLKGKDDLYIQASARSTDKDMRDAWFMLPDETKAYIRQTFGMDALPIRAEFKDVVLGYRKVTIADLWKEGGIDNNAFQRVIKSMFEMAFNDKALMRASQIERGLQDAVRVAKTNIVVRSTEVLAVNVLSNMYQLVVNGVGAKEAIAGQYAEYRNAVQYVKNASRIADIDLLIEANHIPGNRTKLLSEKAQLSAIQSGNPIGELVEAGLLQAIVQDMSQDPDPFSYSSRLMEKADQSVFSRLPQGVTDATKFAFMTRDSASFAWLNKITQYSDLAARAVLYKKLTTRTNNPLDKASALKYVIEEFVNYDLPTHRTIQYGNDMGVLWFTRYWLRSQKIILRNFADNPGRATLFLLAQQALNVDVPDNVDSGILNTGVFHTIRGPESLLSGLMSNPIIPN